MELVNRTRSAAGRSPLAWSPRLAVIARGHSYDMALRHYLAHQSLDGVSPAQRIHGEGIGYQELGENIYLSARTSTWTRIQRLSLRNAPWGDGWQARFIATICSQPIFASRESASRRGRMARATLLRISFAKRAISLFAG